MMAALLWLTLTAMSKAFEYGRIWHSQIHPMSNVTVVLPNDRVAQGALSTEWSGEYRLLLADGSAIEFRRTAGAQSRARTELRCRRSGAAAQALLS